ncbi:MAG: class I SAM-dependent methyltransferase [Chloroflexi bacterium]|nr:class I SAM-dependent methyltransferase [Chloroflexota bacterium]
MSLDRESSKNLAEYQGKYRDRSLILRYANRRFFQTIDSLVGTLPHSSLLDAGCGEGLILKRLATNGDASYTGVDLDPARVALAHENSVSKLLLVGNVEHLPLADDAFDLVLLLEVFEHVGDPAQALREVHRVTRRYLLASVPNEPWWRIGNMARLKYLRQWGNTPEHINHWSVRGFGRFLSDRFSIKEVRTPLLWTFIVGEKRH